MIEFIFSGFEFFWVAFGRDKMEAGENKVPNEINDTNNKEDGKNALNNVIDIELGIGGGKAIIV